jgi:hypothetical protein
MATARWVTAALLLGLAACANVWGFANLTSEDHNDAGDGSAGGDATNSPCSPGNGTGCSGKCAGDASPCGCLVDLGSLTTYCGVAGTGAPGSSCTADLNCGPGYGCQTTTDQCTRWCGPGSPACPTGTSCHIDTTLVLNGNEQFGFCY